MPGRASRSSSSSLKAPVTKPTVTPQVVQHNHQIQQPGFFSNILQGFGLGTGQAIAHNIFRSDPVVKHVTVPTNTSETQHQPKAYIQCMKEYDNKDLCEQYLENK